MYLATSALIKQLDNIAVTEYGFSINLLMENAGKVLYENIIRDYPDKSFSIFCGKGNNGGDGLVLSRYLSNNGFKVEVFLVEDVNDLSYECKRMYDMAIDSSVTVKKYTDKVSKDSVIVDAILGISLRGEPKGNSGKAIEIINKLNNKVISVDIPSGLSADDGKAAGVCIRAERTYTLAFDKVGLNIYPGREIAGKVSVLDIGIPKEATKKMLFSVYKTDNDLVKRLLPKRKENSHKGNFGKVGIVGGSKGMAGSVCMAAKAALRAGSGLVYVFVPDEIFDVVSVKLQEAIVVRDCKLNDYINKLDAVAVGMGCAQNKGIKHIMKLIIQNFHKSVIIDADGINFISKNIKLLEKRCCPIIFTPHPAEFSRLTGIELCDIEENRIYLTGKFAGEYKSAILLKGASTVISSQRGEIRINTTGNSGMATAGSGDVLSGIIAGLCAQGLNIFDAASVGAYIHGIAGDIGKEKYTEYSLIANDIIENISYAYKKIL